MSVIERERIATNSDNDNGVPRLRHICLPPDDGEKHWKPLCGAVLPIIPDYDMKKDRGPAKTADCVVCRDLYVTWGGVW